MTQTLPYGSWPSPLTAEAVTAASPRIDGARFAGDEVWWGQSVPEQGGRVAVFRRGSDGSPEAILPEPWNARSAVHEYGGGAWTATDDGELLFVEKRDQRIRALFPGLPPRALTPEAEGTRYGGLVWSAGVLLAVREVHGDGRTPRREIVSVPRDGSAAEDAAHIRVLAAGDDFVAQPAVSADGTRLAWIGWNHPDMPWDRTALRMREIAGGETVTVVDRGSAPLQPVFAGDDLVFSDDPTGRWNLYRAADSGDPIALSPTDEDTGGALWVLGARWFGLLADGRILAVRTDGRDRLVVQDPDGTVHELDVPLSAGVQVEDVRGTAALVSGAGATTSSGVWLLDLVDGSAQLVAGGAAPAEEAWIPHPRAFDVDGPHGIVHAVDYPPTHPEVEPLEDELPPYVVWVHGGPTSHVGASASEKVAYFTSRGIGVLDVNYGGSTGYGRAYRERLKGQWGVVDVDDVAAAAAGLAAAGRADPARLAIEGGSAGGWTVLSALVRTDVFAAGVSRYGVGDARALAEDTHDFEARYLDGLIGPLPDADEVYRERSPLSHTDRFRVPLLIQQGDEDAVVPPAQAEAIRDALVEHGVPYAYVLYQGEGHGFRRQETMRHSLESEYAFLGRVFGFPTPDVPPLDLSIGGLTPGDGPRGRELRIEDGSPASLRNLELMVSHEAARPLYASTTEEAWSDVLESAGFMPVTSAAGVYVLMPTLDGA